jgi:quercetin 2,3-dioxygenase
MNHSGQSCGRLAGRDSGVVDGARTLGGMSERRVVKVVTGEPASDGAGVRLNRVIGTPTLDHVDPFLLLDEFKSDRADDYLAGFPDHPHRGFETVTYMLAGAMRHQDHAGNSGDLVAGSVQWMTAGRGIIHSEMPRQQDGLMWGFQLWINLPARDKMTAPRYQDIPPERIPEATLAPGVRARVIAGEAGGTRGPVSGIVTAPLYLDVRMDLGARTSLPLTPGHSAFVYVYEGHAWLGNGDGAREGAPDGAREGAPDGAREVAAGQAAVLGDGDRLEVATGEGPARFLLLAARPLREPIARYGPFVMNTRAELVQAAEDFERGKF